MITLDVGQIGSYLIYPVLFAGALVVVFLLSRRNVQPAATATKPVAMPWPELRQDVPRPEKPAPLKMSAKVPTYEEHAKAIHERRQIELARREEIKKQWEAEDADYAALQMLTSK